ncbi:uncharacterized protein C8Q71DRAFT_282747 [Rhodofomes roseus]|uniref:BTB domain-containing protein n=1 Tax=Rhodofomes roseus TaxID=34475 RepID=A0ABQ8K487_9APHY|nr:uncharacterized protein C8Q71DRAFT_282747 [Rhodofomes roseus]KAH9831714.1 hypothetical protein C8Q71DRAFT_282747 [Rhodofomes roseus]
MADSDSEFASVVDEKVASQPFDDPDADLIIRTSDEVDFRVYKIIMKHASPVFREMFTLPGNDTTALSVVDVAENSRVWDFILRMLYPVVRPLSLPAPSDYRPLLEAVRKYDMAGVREAVKLAMIDPAVLKTQALRVYALSCAYGLPDAARIAAKATFQPWPGDQRPPPAFPDMDCMSVTAYHRLLQYRWDCVKAAVASHRGLFDPLPTPPSWDPKLKKYLPSLPQWPWLTAIKPNHYSHTDGCMCSKIREDSGIRSYVDRYIGRSSKVLRAEPSGALVTTTQAIGPMLKAVAECWGCKEMDSDGFVRFAGVYAQNVDAAVARVRTTEDAICHPLTKDYKVVLEV